MPSFAARWLLPRIGRFVAAHPDIDLDVRANNALADFRRDDVDAAIRYGSGNYPGLVTDYLMDDEYFIVCSPRIAGGIPKRPVDLERYLLLHSEREFWQPWFAVAGLDWPEPTRGPTFNDTSHALQAAIEGQGIALARTSLIGNDLANGVLVRPFEIFVASPHKYYFVCPPRLAESRKIVAMRKWLQAEIAEERERGGAGAGEASKRKAKRSSAPRRPNPGDRRAAS